MISYKIYRHIVLAFLSVLILSDSYAETKDQRIKVNLRSISHEFLMQLGDSTSRIMPIEFEDGRYKVSFENEFSFEPDFLLFATYKLYEENTIQEKFIVEVEECYTKTLVHSFDIGTTDMKACKRRGLPATCYNFYFTEITNYPINDITIKKSETEDQLFWWLTGIGGGLISLCIIIIIIIKLKDKSENQNPEEEIHADLPSLDYLISIGEYRFNKKNMKLEFGDKKDELSTKEANLLLLFNENEDRILERDFILNQVWGDDGTYSGRTLDVFISKLRKKLELDPNLKIINVRSVGYRFVITEKAS